MNSDDFRRRSALVPTTDFGNSALSLLEALEALQPRVIAAGEGGARMFSS